MGDDKGLADLNLKFLLSTEPLGFSPNHFTHCNLQDLI